MNRDSLQKQRIIRIAAKVFAKNGYHAASVSQLSEATGLGRGALYYHIESKEALLWEISHAYVEEILVFAKEVAELDIPPDEKLRLMARAHMKNIADHLPEWTVFFREINALVEERRNQILKVRAEYEAIWEDLYRQGISQGILRDLDPILVKGFLGMLNFTYLWIRADGRLTPEQIADTFIDAFLHGILVNPGDAPPDDNQDQH